jgi:hypothetical protein
VTRQNAVRLTAKQGRAVGGFVPGAGLCEPPNPPGLRAFAPGKPEMKIQRLVPSLRLSAEYLDTEARLGGGE